MHRTTENLGANALPAMVDPFNRAISYLRVSVTDRCDLRCVYCMSEDMTFYRKLTSLTLEELDRLCSVFIAKGVTKLRLTGGEPLVRRNVLDLIRSLSRHLRSGALKRADAHHKRIIVGQVCSRACGLWRSAYQCIVGHARSG